MPSTLAWLDFDASAQERTKRILALFREKGTVDQMGLGSIRDSFSDLLFPGTSTIQTRLRYFLFVPWIYQELEGKEIPSRRIAGVARSRELALIKPLLSSKEEGVFGRTAGGDLKRLPSEVYWGGLGSWGLRRFDASRAQYHRALDEIYRRRRQAKRNSSEGTENDQGVITWHPEIPPPPNSFPEKVALALTREEADFLRDRIVDEHPSSLLAWLALHPTKTEILFPWQHPLHEAMTAKHRDILHHARLFSRMMNGAPILYNLMLAEEGNRADLVVEYKDRFREWAESIEEEGVASWDLSELFSVAQGQGGHNISFQTREFVRQWVELARSNPLNIVNSSQARTLIRHREMFLKGPHSLFRNQKALEERYDGGLGMGRLNYRWSDVQVLLNDLYEGLRGS